MRVAPENRFRQTQRTEHVREVRALSQSCPHHGHSGLNHRKLLLQYSSHAFSYHRILNGYTSTSSCSDQDCAQRAGFPLQSAFVAILIVLSWSSWKYLRKAAESRMESLRKPYMRPEKAVRGPRESLPAFLRKPAAVPGEALPSPFPPGSFFVDNHLSVSYSIDALE